MTMKHNRRNYYRILHVQMDAPTEIIKASYRTCMQKLRAHPDLGGDNWNAALINAALAVLSNPEKRQRYDRELTEKQTFKRDVANIETKTTAAENHPEKRRWIRRYARALFILRRTTDQHRHNRVPALPESIDTPYFRQPFTDRPARIQPHGSPLSNRGLCVLASGQCLPGAYSQSDTGWRNDNAGTSTVN